MEVSCASVLGIWQISHYYPQMSFRFNGARVEKNGDHLFSLQNDTNASFGCTVNQTQQDLEVSCRKEKENIDPGSAGYAVPYIVHSCLYFWRHLIRLTEITVKKRVVTVYLMLILWHTEKW